MISSIELEIPRLTCTLMLPEWDLDIVLEALSKPPYEPLREASPTHLTIHLSLPPSHGLDSGA